MAEQRKVLEREDALALARQGKDAWNAWAGKHEGWSVDFSKVDFTYYKNSSINFNGFVFPGYAFFHQVKFEKGDFEGAIFNGDVTFYMATFGEVANFNHAVFNSNAEFGEAVFDVKASFVCCQFLKNATFQGAKFKDDVDLIAANFSAEDHSTDFMRVSFDSSLSLVFSKFTSVPDFRLTKFEKHVSLHDITVNYQIKKGSGFKHAKHKDDEDRYRRLKELATIAKDHEAEQQFFAYELMAKWHYKVTGPVLWLNYLYYWVSDFGRSIIRPIKFMACIWLFFSFTFYLIAIQKAYDPPFEHAITYSAMNLLPIPGVARIAHVAAEKGLFKPEGPVIPTPGKKQLTDIVPTIVFWLAALENILGAILLFLIGLALRNRFRI